MGLIICFGWIDDDKFDCVFMQLMIDRDASFTA